MQPHPRLLLLVALIWSLSTASVWADVPTNLSVQGRLTDGSGVPVPAGAKTFTFKIFDAVAGGTEIWPGGAGESQAISTDADGLWSAAVGRNIPLPEAVFQDTARWLEVTVDDGVNPPETLSRIKLNTNPFTYRSASSQNADAVGGLTVADLDNQHVNIAGDVMTGVLEVPQVVVGNSGYNGEVNLWADGDPDPGISLFTFPGAGGAWRTFDGLHNITTTAVPSPYGEGGTFAVLGTASESLGQAFLVDGNSDGAGNPQVVIAGLSSTSTFSTSITGSGSVELPVDAVEASEILDEPGLATSAAPDSGFIGDQDTIIATATATFPAPGYALILAEANFGAFAYATYMSCTMERNGNPIDAWYWDGGDKDDNMDQHQCRSLVDTITAAGVYTYDLHLQSFTTGLQLHHQKVIVLFVPTAYGSVTLPLAAGGDPATDGAQLTQQDATNEPMLSREAAIQVSIDANQIRIDREMAAMQARIAALEKKLQDAQQVGVTKEELR